MDKPGDWEISVEARVPGQASPAAVSGPLAVAPEQTGLGKNAGYIALPFLALIILASHLRDQTQAWVGDKTHLPAAALDLARICALACELHKSSQFQNLLASSQRPGDT